MSRRTMNNRTSEIYAAPGSFLGIGVSSFSNSGCTSGRLLGCGVIHSCIQKSSDIDTAA